MQPQQQKPRLPFYTKLISLLGVSLILAGVAAGCAPAPASPPTTTETAAATTESTTEATASEKVLRIGTGADILTLDPARMVQVPDWPIATAIYSSLVKYKAGLTAEVEPDLAESWEISEDGTVYTFHLRQGVQWQGGYGEVTAEDVKFSYDRIRDPDSGSAYVGDLALITDISVLDPYTVQFTFSSAYAPFLSAVAAFRPGRIISQAAVEELGEDYTANAIGSGPYQLESWTPGAEIVLAKNAEYWDADNYAIDTIIYRIIPEPAVRALALQAGEIDIAHPDDPEGIAMLGNSPGVVLAEEPGTNIVKLSFNHQKAPFDQIEVRQAIAHAIDRAAIAEFALDGIASPAISEIPPFMLGYTDEVNSYDYDPEAARALLAEAGFVDGLDMNVIVWNWGSYPRAAEALPAMLAEVGINLNLEIVEGSLIQTRFAEGSYDAALYGLGRVDPHQVLYASYISTAIPPNGANRARYVNPAVDELLNAQAAAVDTVERVAILEELQQVLVEDAATVPLYIEKIYVAHGENVVGALPASQMLLAWDLLDITE